MCSLSGLFTSAALSAYRSLSVCYTAPLSASFQNSPPFQLLVLRPISKHRNLIFSVTTNAVFSKLSFMDSHLRLLFLLRLITAFTASPLKLPPSTVNSNGFAYFQALTARLSATYCSATLP